MSLMISLIREGGILCLWSLLTCRNRTKGRLRQVFAFLEVFVSLWMYHPFGLQSHCICVRSCCTCRASCVTPKQKRNKTSVKIPQHQGSTILKVKRHEIDRVKAVDRFLHRAAITLHSFFWVVMPPHSQPSNCSRNAHRWCAVIGRPRSARLKGTPGMDVGHMNEI